MQIDIKIDTVNRDVKNIDKSIHADGPVIVFEKDGSGPTVGTRVSDQDKADIKKSADADGLSDSDWIRQAIEGRKKFTESEFLKILVYHREISSILSEHFPKISSLNVKGATFLFIGRAGK